MKSPVLAPPRVRSIRPIDAGALVAGNAVIILAMWVRHGGLSTVAGGFGGALTGAGQVTGLLGTYLVLVQVVLMSRSPWLEQRFGLDRLAVWHRWVGFGCVDLLVAHAVLIAAGYAATDHVGVPRETWRLLTTYPDVLTATAGLALFGAVAVASVRIARRRLRYETWYFIHLYTYLAIALSFAHQLATGVDFVDDPIARGYWIALYLATAVLLVVFRVAQPLMTASRHRLRVDRIEPEAPGVFSIYVTGRELDRLPLRAGQFFLWRFMTREGWWRAHPFSVSAAPNGSFLRITIKQLGDYTAELHRLQPGTPVIAEGPYGAFTGLARTRPRVLLVAGGVGIVPLRALLEEIPVQPGDTDLVYRARSWEDVVFRDELDALAAERQFTIHWLIGQRNMAPLRNDPLAPALFTRIVPDVRERDVFVCGPPGMIAAVRRSMRALGVPNRQIHEERFAY